MEYTTVDQSSPEFDAFMPKAKEMIAQAILVGNGVGADWSDTFIMVMCDDSTGESKVALMAGDTMRKKCNDDPDNSHPVINLLATPHMPGMARAIIWMPREYKISYAKLVPKSGTQNANQQGMVN